MGRGGFTAEHLEENTSRGGHSWWRESVQERGSTWSGEGNAEESSPQGGSSSGLTAPPCPLPLCRGERRERDGAQAEAGKEGGVWEGGKGV